jgi:hypothetical protein
MCDGGGRRSERSAYLPTDHRTVGPDRRALVLDVARGTIAPSDRALLERPLSAKPMALEKLPHDGGRIDLRLCPGVAEAIDANHSNLGARAAFLVAHR